MVRDNHHDSVHLFGAMVAPRAHAILVCDGAGWRQNGQHLRAPATVTLLKSGMPSEGRRHPALALCFDA